VLRLLGDGGQEMMAPRKSLYVYAIYVHTDRRERHRQTGTGGDHVFYFPGPVTLNCFIVPLLDHVQLSIQPSLAALRTKPYPGFIQTSNRIFFGLYVYIVWPAEDIRLWDFCNIL
jgi:hypothetical protein